MLFATRIITKRFPASPTTNMKKVIVAAVFFFVGVFIGIDMRGLYAMYEDWANPPVASVPIKVQEHVDCETAGGVNVSYWIDPNAPQRIEHVRADAACRWAAKEDLLISEAVVEWCKATKTELSVAEQKTCDKEATRVKALKSLSL